MKFSTEQIGHLPDEAQDDLRALLRASRSYRDDPEFRTRIETDSRGALEDAGLSINVPGFDVQVSANTEDIFHVVMPANPNIALSDESMQQAVGGSTASSAATAGSASTLGCFASCASSAGSASTLGSAGSAS